MARSVKSSESKSNVPASASSSAQVATPAPKVVEKAPRASRARVVAPVVPVVESAQVAVSTTEQSAQNVEVVVAASEDDLASAFADAFDKLQKVTSMLSALRSDFRQLERRTTRELKVANKSSSKRRRKPGNRSPSGFVKPTLISVELATFLGKQPGTEMARTEVTREINTYIRNNNLQDKANGRKINPDESLSKLLKLNETDELTYFNLQRYMSPHFAKAVKPVVAVVAVEAQ
jgi:chromatin remodeling complex protein RSC6